MGTTIRNIIDYVKNPEKTDNVMRIRWPHKLHMSVRTIIELEGCKSNPRFETVATIARELDISLDAVFFQNVQTDSVSKPVTDFFFGKSEEKIQKYIALCERVSSIRTIKGD